MSAIKIGGKRGKQFGKGYSLKFTNGETGAAYVYVWDAFCHTETIQKRKKYSKNYSKSEGWRSLGRYGLAETMEKLLQHLQDKYQLSDEQIAQIEGEIEGEYEIKRQKYLEKKKNHTKNT